MDEKKRQRMAEQRATNAQTVTFVANQEADIVTAAEERAESDPIWVEIADTERERVRTLMDVADAERRLAAALTAGTADSGTVAAAERELRKDLMEIARAEGHLAEELKALESEDDYGPALLADQAAWNRNLLRHVAHTATKADRALRRNDGHA